MPGIWFSPIGPFQFFEITSFRKTKYGLHVLYTVTVRQRKSVLIQLPSLFLSSSLYSFSLPPFSIVFPQSTLPTLGAPRICLSIWSSVEYVVIFLSPLHSFESVLSNLNKHTSFFCFFFNFFYTLRLFFPFDKIPIFFRSLFSFSTNRFKPEYTN